MEKNGSKSRLLIWVLVLCLWALSGVGWSHPCVPECPDCYTCVDGECENDCEVGEGCCNDSCCDGTCCGGTACCEDGQECCNGECVDECQIVDGDSCDGGTVGACFACELFGSCGGDVKRYNGGTEKICSPRGCSCTDDTKVCYTTKQCNPTGHFMPFAGCGGVGPGPVGCVVVFPITTFCFYCFEDDNSEEYHYVDDDSCN